MSQDTHILLHFIQILAQEHIVVSCWSIQCLQDQGNQQHCKRQQLRLILMLWVMEMVWCTQWVILKVHLTRKH